MNSVAAISGGRFGLNGCIVEVHTAASFHRRELIGIYRVTLFRCFIQDQFSIRRRIVVNQVIEFGPFVHVFSVGLFHLVTVDRDGIYIPVLYGNAFFTNRDDKARYGRFFSSSSPVSRTKALRFQRSQGFLVVRKHMI